MHDCLQFFHSYVSKSFNSIFFNAQTNTWELIAFFEHRWFQQIYQFIGEIIQKCNKVFDFERIGNSIRFEWILHNFPWTSFPVKLQWNSSNIYLYKWIFIIMKHLRGAIFPVIEWHNFNLEYWNEKTFDIQTNVHSMLKNANTVLRTEWKFTEMFSIESISHSIFVAEKKNQFHPMRVYY